MFRIFSIAILLFAVSSRGSAQSVTDSLLHKNYNGVTFSDFVKQIESQYPVRFFYNPEWISGITVKQTQAANSLHEVLKETLAEVRLDYVPLFGKFIVLVNSEYTRTSQQADDPSRKFTLSGYIRNAQTGVGLVGATVNLLGTTEGTTTDPNGFFSLTVPAGNHDIVFAALGFSASTRMIRIFSNITTAVELFEEVRQLDEVVISGAAHQHVHSLSLGEQQINTASLKALPPLLGEVDIVRSVLSLPGISSVGEGASGFNVRGGNVDQNLILIDHAPLYNASHLFGLFSVVNSDIVNGMILHKGTMPSRYGGRLSAVLDINLQDRVDSQSPEVDASLGIISSKLKATVPIIKNKTSLVCAVRGAYPDWMLQIVPDKDLRNSSANFYDATLKIAHRLNTKNFLTLTAHLSGDAFRLGADTTYKWSGKASSFQWVHYSSPKVTSRFSLYYSENNNNVTAQSFVNGFNLSSGIKTTGFNFDVEVEPNSNHQLQFGIQSNHHATQRGDFEPRGAESVLQPVTIPAERGVETGVYLSDAITLSPVISISPGIRISSFLAFGSGVVRLYAEGQPRNAGTFVGEQFIGSREIEKSFVNIEPRVSAKISLTSQSSLKGGYSRNVQYLSLLSNTAAVSPLDVWKLSDMYLRPQQCDQFSIGYFKQALNQKFEFSAEMYYKLFSDITQYKPGARLILNEQIETDLLQGEGKSFGFELYAKKNDGKLTGWLSYTFARSFIKVSGRFQEETLSKGNYFPSNFDKPHDLGMVLNYAVSRKVTFSSNFVYSTGRPVTYPESVYVLDGYVIANYSEINQARIPDYHRLDLSMTHKMLQKRNRKLETSWSLGAYNVYGRRNPFSVFFKPAHSGRYPQAYRLSVLGTIIPYFSWNFKIK